MDQRYNELPPLWDVTPHALLGIVGAKQHHENMRVALLEQCRKSDKTQPGSLKAFDAISLADDFQIPAKSNPPVSIKRFQTPIRGLLKTDWMQKWHSVVPGLILLMVDLKQAGRTWDEQEAFVCDQVERLRRKTLERRINIAVILVLTAAEAPRDEQLFSLKKRGSLDAKQVYKLTPRELSKPDCAMVSKTWKNAQEMLVSFYSNAVRKYNKHLKLVKNYVPLEARHTFKIAYFLEVLGESHKAGKQYRTAMRLATAINPSSKHPFGTEQVKVFAALCMWRIYSRTLRDKNAVDAHRSEIFRGFLVHFRKHVGACRYRHFGWLAQQCLVFARQVDGFDEASSVLERPVHFRNLAVQYAVEQRRAAQAAGVYRSEVMPTTASFSIVPPEFVGGVPTVIDDATGEPFDTAAAEGAFHALERQVDHSANIKTVLAECIAYEERALQARLAAAARRKSGSASTSPKAGAGGKKTKASAKAAKAAKAAAASAARFFVRPAALATTTRSLARKQCVMAEECIHSGDFPAALELLQRVLPVYEDCHWASLARVVLLQLQDTALRCGAHAAYVDASLRLLARFPDLQAEAAVGDQVLAAFAAHRQAAAAAPADATAGTDANANANANADADADADADASAAGACAGEPMEVVIRDGLTSGLFSVRCAFDQASASPNDTVGVAVVLVSHFPVPVTCRLPRACFSDPRYDCELRAAGATDATGCVVLPVGTPVRFTTQVVVAAEAVAKPGAASSSAGAMDDAADDPAAAAAAAGSSLRLERVTTALVDQSKNDLCRLVVPTDDDGAKSIAATAAHANVSRAGVASSTAAAATGLSQEARAKQRQYWLAIVPAVAQAAVEISGDSVTLFGAVHRFRVDIAAGGDVCAGASLALQIDGLRAATAGTDIECRVEGVSVPRPAAPQAGEKGAEEEEGAAEALVMAGGADDSRGGALDLDPATGAAAPAVAIPDLSPGHRCTVVVAVVARAVQKFHLRATLHYSNAKQCAVATAPGALAWKCVNPVDVRHTVDYVQPNVWPWLAVGQPFVVRSEYTCNSVHPVELLQVDSKVANKAAVAELVVPVWQQQPPGADVRVLAALAPGDVFSTVNKFSPSRPFRGSVGHAIVHWRHAGARGRKSHSTFGIERTFPFPAVHADVVPVGVAVGVPALVHCGEAFTLRVELANQTDRLQTVSLRIAADDKFFLSGNECVTVSVLGRRVKPGMTLGALVSQGAATAQAEAPAAVEVVEWQLLPLVASEGTVNLPRITVLSADYGRQLLDPADVPKLFVRPAREY